MGSATEPGRHRTTRTSKPRFRVGVTALLLVLGMVTIPATGASAAAATSSVRVQLTAPYQQYGTPISAVATARSNGKAVPGKVRYFFDGKLAYEARTNSAGATKWRLQGSIPVGTHRLTVYFLPSVGGVKTSAVATTVQVRKATPTISVAVPRSKPPFGSMTTMSMAVSAKNLGWARGTVDLYEGTRYIASSTLGNGSTQIHFRLTSTPGNNVFTVKYRGSAAIAAHSRAVRFATSRTLSSVGITSLNAATSGGTVSAKVTGKGPRVATGSVSAVVDGRTVSTRSLSSGSASLPLGKLSSGTHSVKVRYHGDLRYVNSVSAPRAAKVSSFNNPCSPSARACIDLTNNLTWVQENGRIIYGPVPMTSGRPGYRTNPGMFSVYWKHIDHKSSIFNDAPMPYAIFFDGGIAFHEGSLYVPSHGCLHLSHSAAVYYWNALDYGDSVHVFGTAQY